MAAIHRMVNAMCEPDEKWVLCPICGAKNRLRLLQKTVLKDFPLFCPKCRQEHIINARNFQIEIIDQPDAKDAVLTTHIVVGTASFSGGKL